jgi:transcriptional regulator with XRE-family HTH domain
MIMAKPGSRFKRIYEEARRHHDYWMEDLRLQFLSEISALMEEKGLSQKSLAESMNVSEAYISKFFNDNVSKNFTMKTLIEVSRAIGAVVRISVIPAQEEEESKWSLQDSSLETPSWPFRTSGDGIKEWYSPDNRKDKVLAA